MWKYMKYAVHIPNLSALTHLPFLCPINITPPLTKAHYKMYDPSSNNPEWPPNTPHKIDVSAFLMNRNFTNICFSKTAAIPSPKTIGIRYTYAQNPTNTYFKMPNSRPIPDLNVRLGKWFHWTANRCSKVHQTFCNISCLESIACKVDRYHRSDSHLE